MRNLPQEGYLPPAHLSLQTQPGLIRSTIWKLGNIPRRALHPPPPSFSASWPASHEDIVHQRNLSSIPAHFIYGFSVNRSLIWWCSIWFLSNIVVGRCRTAAGVVKAVLTSWTAALLPSKGVSLKESTCSSANIRKSTNPMKVNDV